MRVLEQQGFIPAGFFFLPYESWMETYYKPMRGRFDSFLEKHGHAPEAVSIVENESLEIDLYEQYKDYISYGFFIAQKR